MAQFCSSLDMRKLERELASAVETEDRRQRVDDMKKRAIVAARDYDEFRHLVACANQKTVTRQEMESLGKPKLAAGLGSSSSVRYSSSRDKAVARAKAKAAAKRQRDAAAGRGGAAVPTTAPTTSREFERVWRRQCTSLELRWRYSLTSHSSVAHWTPSIVT